MIDTTPTPQPAVTGTVSRECVDRVRAAIRNSGFAWPGGNIDIATAGCTSAEDLAIAAAVLAAASTVSPARLGSTVLLAELGLDGTLRAVHGILARVLAARDAGYTHVVLAPAGYAEASLVDGITVHAMATLADVVTWLNQDATATSDARPPAVVEPMPTSDASPHSDGTGAVAAMLRDTEIRDALVVAAAGGHPILITTRSRSSAAVLARAVHALLPELSPAAAATVTALHSAAEQLDPPRWITRPPFLAPQPAVSLTTLLGDPDSRHGLGMLDLARHGVLVLHDAPSFPADTQHALDRRLSAHTNRTPDRCAPSLVPQLVMSLAPCRCGAGTRERCPCTPQQQASQQRSIVAPLRARADIHLRIDTPIPQNTTAEATPALPELRQRVADARARACRRRSRTEQRTSALLAELPPDVRHVVSALTDTGILAAAEVRRCLRVAETVADLDAAPLISPDHVAHALTLIGDASHLSAPGPGSV